MPILVFIGLSVLDLGPMYATDRQTDRETDRQTSDRQTDVRRQTPDAHHRLMPPPIRGGGITIVARASSIQFPLPARPVTFLCFSVSTIILNVFYLNFMQRSDGCDGNG